MTRSSAGGSGGPGGLGGSGGRRVRTALTTIAVVALAATATGCAGAEQTGSPAHRVSTWMSGSGGGAAIGALTDAVNSVDRALAEHQPSGVVHTLCVALVNAAQAGNDNLPTPDEELTTDLSNGYGAAFSAGNDCYLVASGDMSVAARAASERARALVLMNAAVSRITQVTGKAPSTTTTTAPPGTNSDPFGGS